MQHLCLKRPVNAADAATKLTLSIVVFWVERAFLRVCH